MFKPNELEKFFSLMPSTKRLIEELWNLDRSELIDILKEYMRVMGFNAYGYDYFDSLVGHASTAPHEYINPWKVL